MGLPPGWPGNPAGWYRLSGQGSASYVERLLGQGEGTLERAPGFLWLGSSELSWFSSVFKGLFIQLFCSGTFQIIYIAPFSFFK